MEKEIMKKAFNSRRNLISMVNNSKKIKVQVHSELCNILKKLPKKKIGEGVKGRAYEFSYEGKQYVLKEDMNFINDLEELDCFFVPKDVNIRDIIEKVDEDLLVPKHTYLCGNNIIPEAYIGSILGEAYENGECVNFFNTYAVFACENKTSNRENLYQYIIMDKVDGPFLHKGTCRKINEYIEELSSTDIDENMLTNFQEGVYIQLIFAIAFYQENFNISHNDLHQDNIFAEYITENTTFDGKKVIDYDYFCYKIIEIDMSKGKPKETEYTYYFPATPIFIKIADFGMAVKYPTPKNNFIMGNMNIVQKVYGDFYPTVKYYPSYDGIYASCVLNMYFSGEKGYVPEFKTELIKDSLKFMTNNSKPKDYLTLGGSGNSCRPKLYDEKFKSPFELLKSKVFEKFKKKPDNKNILCIGEIIV